MTDLCFLLLPSRLRRATFLKEEGVNSSLFEGAVSKADWGSFINSDKYSIIVDDIILDLMHNLEKWD